MATWTRTETVSAKNGGQACPTLSEQRACPVDCEMSSWSNFACVNGRRQRTRTILVNALNGGQACGPLIDTPPDNNSDGDSATDPCDGCPFDGRKTSPGLCGCGVEDTDSDADLTLDCHDGCPFNRNRTTPGPCGCQIPAGMEECGGACVTQCTGGKVRSGCNSCACPSGAPNLCIVDNSCRGACGGCKRFNQATCQCENPYCEFGNYPDGCCMPKPEDPCADCPFGGRCCFPGGSCTTCCNWRPVQVCDVRCANGCDELCRTGCCYTTTLECAD